MPPRWSYSFQRDYFRQRSDLGQSYSTDSCNTLATSVNNVCHRFGVNVESGKVFVLGERILLSLNLSAGDWHAHFEGRTTTTGHVGGRLCARILRFLESHHEELG